MIAAIIRQLLAEGGFGTIETDLFEDRLPPSPKDAIGVFSFESGDPVRGLCPERVQDFAPFQVQIRRGTQAEARDDAYAIYDYLDSIVNETPSGFARIEEISVRYPARIRRDIGEPQLVVFGVSGDAIVDLP
jgi:hypothetical protein